MALKMNYDTWRAESLGPRWLWENTRSLQLCLMDRHAESLKAQLASGVGSILAEFQLPLQIEIANQRTLDLIERLVTGCSLNTAINCWSFLETLNEKRHGEPSLQTGLVIAFDGNQRHLLDESPHKPQEPPKWGWTQEDGLILLRLEQGQPLRNVVRHEMGHLLGIGQHHPHCVMAWECGSETFCDHCKTIIAETCRVVD